MRVASSAWTEEEDEQLRKLVAKFGLKKWVAISRELKSKSSKPCRRRWRNVLDAKLKKGDWDAKEDAILLAVKNRFAAITKRTGGVIDPALIASLPTLELPTYNKDGSDDDVDADSYGDEDEMDEPKDYNHRAPSTSSPMLKPAAQSSRQPSTTQTAPQLLARLQSSRQPSSIQISPQLLALLQSSRQRSTTQTAPQSLAQPQSRGQTKPGGREQGNPELPPYASAPHHPQTELASRRSNSSTRSQQAHIQASKTPQTPRAGATYAPIDPSTMPQPHKRPQINPVTPRSPGKDSTRPGNSRPATSLVNSCPGPLLGADAGAGGWSVTPVPHSQGAANLAAIVGPKSGRRQPGCHCGPEVW
eukprot:gene28189-31279_t